MKPLFPTRILRVFRHAQSLCALPQKKSPLPISQHPQLTTVLRLCKLSDEWVVFRASPHSLATTRHRSLTPFNSHRARVRRRAA